MTQRPPPPPPHAVFQKASHKTREGWVSSTKADGGGSHTGPVSDDPAKTKKANVAGSSSSTGAPTARLDPVHWDGARAEQPRGICPGDRHGPLCGHDVRAPSGVADVVPRVWYFCMLLMVGRAMLHSLLVRFLHNGVSFLFVVPFCSIEVHVCTVIKYLRNVSQRTGTRSKTFSPHGLELKSTAVPNNTPGDGRTVCHADGPLLNTYLILAEGRRYIMSRLVAVKHSWCNVHRLLTLRLRLFAVPSFGKRCVYFLLTVPPNLIE